MLCQVSFPSPKHSPTTRAESGRGKRAFVVLKRVDGLMGSCPGGGWVGSRGQVTSRGTPGTEAESRVCFLAQGMLSAGFRGRVRGTRVGLLLPRLLPPTRMSCSRFRGGLAPPTINLPCLVFFPRDRKARYIQAQLSRKEC